MALVATEMKAKFRKTIKSGLSRVFSAEVAKADNYPPIAEEMWDKLADALSDIAMDIVDEMHTNAQVSAGQQVVGTFTGIGSGPVVAATVSPGKIL